MNFDQLLDVDFSDTSRTLDLELENRALELEVKRRGGSVKPYDNAPALRNAFLKRVLAFEEASRESERPIRDLFPREDFALPPVDSLETGELQTLLRRIREVLEQNGLALELTGSLPDPVLYKYLAEEVIPQDTFQHMVPGIVTVLDGCTGFCDECFQRGFCEIGQEALLESDGKILQGRVAIPDQP